jgi:predicted nucleic acid-binding protein
LLDTNVISKFAPNKPEPSKALVQWMTDKGAADELFISVITLAEIQVGIKELERRGASAKAVDLKHWFDGIVSMFDDRILSMDTAVALAAGDIQALARGTEHDPGLADVIIAASARANDLVVVTENIRHFQPLGVAVQFPEGD